MIELTHGNLLTSRADALVNTVNTVGVMGRGIALQFKQAYPQMFDAYEAACKSNKVSLGTMHSFDLGASAGAPRWIINFPTKGHWRASSDIRDIEAGLKNLVDLVRKLRIRSIAVPPLGCGNGGLPWEQVQALIEKAFNQLPDVRVLLFAPGEMPEAATMPNRTPQPEMTTGQAAMILLMDRYLKGLLDPLISLLELHKLMYFMQVAGQPLRLRFQADRYGPYASNLRHVLVRLESHYTLGYGDGRDDPSKPIELIEGAVQKAEGLLAADLETRARLDRVGSLIEGYEDAFGLELLSSVHWVMTSGPACEESSVVRAIHSWTERKRQLFKPLHIANARKRLVALGWARREPECAGDN